MNFFLPLAFPDSQIKCIVYETKANIKSELNCKVQKKFNFVDSIIIEERMIKNIHKEILYIKSKRIDFNTSFSCENYNIIKLELTKKRYMANYIYLQLSKMKIVGRKVEFFMAFALKYKISIDQKHFETNIKYALESNNLRELQEESLASIELPATCNVKTAFDFACGFNCGTDREVNGKPRGMELNTDSISDISGIPDNADPSKLNYSIDYSIPANLALIGNLPIIRIDSINGSICEKDGTYTIKGLVTKGDLINYKNVEIPFSSPDSSGICEIITQNKNNKEKFDISSIIFAPTIIQDFDNKVIFILDEYYNQKRFACAMSSYSETPNKENDTTIINNNYNSSKIIMRKKSNGLTGGSIAAIVICSVVVLALVAIITIIFSVKGKNTNKLIKISEMNKVTSDVVPIHSL